MDYVYCWLMYADFDLGVRVSKFEHCCVKFDFDKLECDLH